MSSVDNRVVDMQFNNRQFENGISTSMKSIENLKNGLNFDTQAKSLSNLERTANSFTLANIAAGVESLSNKFSALGIMGMTAINNITNSAMNAGTNLLKALTIDPVKTGLTEYETKMNAIQTILTNTKSKGTTIDDVNKALGELNTYADQTIYNFAEMTKNIGTFTAAGIDLKTSTQSIKGIANLAAGSGSSALQASTAMYQLSQALAAGKVSLMDWNSVVNAGMGGELFQKALKQTAKDMGKVVDEGKPFRETLQDGWLTADVLTKTLSKFAEDKDLLLAATQVKTFTQMIDTMKESVQSGWAVTWETIIGNKDEAAKLFTSINNSFGAIAGASADARNGMLAFWKENGGRDALIQALANSCKALGSIIGAIGAGFREMFPAMTGERLVEITKNFKDVTEKFKMGDETLYNLKITFKGLFAVLDIAKQTFVVLAGALSEVIKYLLPAVNWFLRFTATIGSYIIALDQAVRSSNVFVVGLQTVGYVVKAIADGIGKSISMILGGFKRFDGVNLSGLDKFADKISVSFDPIIKFGEMIGNGLAQLRDNIVTAFTGANFKPVFDVLNGGLFAAILLGITKFIKSLTSIADDAGGFLGNITGILDGVKGSLEAYQNSLKAGTLLKIAMAVGILAASLMLLASIDSDKLTIALTAMTTVFIELFTAMTMFNTILTGVGLKSLISTTTAMLGLSIAVLILSSAMVKLSSLDWNGIAKGLTSVIVLTATLVLASKALDGSSKGLIKASISFVIFGTALLVLASAVNKLGSIDLGKLTKGLISIGVLLAELTLFMNTANLGNMGIRTGLGFIAMAGGLNILATAVQKFSEIDSGALIKGLIGLGVVLTEIGLFVTLTGDSKRVISTAIGLTILGGAMLIFANALKQFGGMTWSEIGAGLTALGGSLAIVATALSLMQSSLAGAAALLIVAGALAILVPVLKSLGEMSLAQIATSLLTLAATFGVIAVAGLLLTPVIPAIIGLAAAITLLGIGCLAIGAGVLAFSVGVTALAAAGTAGAAAVVLMVSSLINLIPYAAKSLAQGVIDFAKTIGDGAPVIGTAIGKVVYSTIQTMITLIPMIIEGAIKLLTALLDTLLKNMPKLVDTGSKIVISFIEGITKKIPELIQAAFEFVIAFINGVANAIRNNSQLLVEAIQNLITAFIGAGVKMIESSIEKFKEAGKNLIDGFIAGIKAKITDAADWASNLATSVITAAKKVLGIKSPSRVFRDEVGAMVAIGMANGIKLHAKEAKDASEQMAKDAVDSAKEWIDERKYYNKISLDEELYVWEELQRRYAEGSEERIKADKEVYRVQNEINAKRIESEQTVFDASVKLIDDRKYYNKLSLTEELAAWQDLQLKYAEGTSQREKADKEAYRVQQEITNKKKELEDNYYAKTKEVKDKLSQDIQSLNDEYNNALKSRTDALYNAYNMFDKIAAQKPVSGAQLTANLKGQITEFQTWQTNLESLSKKNVSKDFIEELQNMGQKSAQQVLALNQMTTPELTAYVALWKTKHQEAKTQALTELEDLRIQTTIKITALKDQASIDLSNLRSEWRSQLKQLNASSKEELTKLTNTFSDKVDELSTDTQQKFVDLSISIQNIDWVGVGTSIVQGMMTGIQSKSEELAQVAAETALRALEAAKEALGIASPSKEFAKLGMYSNQGFAIGLNRFSGVVETASAGVGYSAMSALKESITNISDIINNDIDISPTIRPVLDMSDIKSGGLLIDKMFNRTQGLNVASVTNKLPNINSQTSTSGINNPVQANGASVSFTQNNYSPKALSRLEIYRQTRNQISAMKGLVSKT